MVAHKNKGEKMYSLTIHFGPNAMVWAFLFKEKPNYESLKSEMHSGPACFSVTDDFGQNGYFRSKEVHGMLLEDLDLVETARIQRSLAEERCKVKLMNAARSDPVISEAIRKQQQGPAVLTPMGGFGRN
jgi:hypothetical protein